MSECQDKECPRCGGRDGSKRRRRPSSVLPATPATAASDTPREERSSADAIAAVPICSTTSLTPRSRSARRHILDRPYVVVSDPPIAPRLGLTYEDIPHLMFSAKEPTRSGLCLFDPAGREWTPADLIAETTIAWSAEWLHFYELWHLCGAWLGPGVGHQSIGRLRVEEARALRSMIAHRLEGEAA
jgi:hypothetical protein